VLRLAIDILCVYAATNGLYKVYIIGDTVTIYPEVELIVVAARRRTTQVRIQCVAANKPSAKIA